MNSIKHLMNQFLRRIRIFFTNWITTIIINAFITAIVGLILHLSLNVPNNRLKTEINTLSSKVTTLKKTKADLRKDSSRLNNKLDSCNNTQQILVDSINNLNRVRPWTIKASRYGPFSIVI